MRYVAVSRPNATAPIQIVGVGDTMDDAYSGARSWFDKAFEDADERRWQDLVAMENNLDAITETELKEKSGFSLDEWLTHLEEVGHSPGTQQPPKAWRDLVFRGDPIGWDRSTWVVLGFLVCMPPTVGFINNWIFWHRYGLDFPILLYLPWLIVGVAVGALYAFILYRIFRHFAGKGVGLDSFVTFFSLFLLTYSLWQAFILKLEMWSSHY
jgi:hypothetical protein